jgi:hypothetical protein
LIAIYQNYNNPNLFGEALKIHLLFLLSINIFYHPQPTISYIGNNLKFYKNNYIFYINLIVILFLIFFSKTGVNIFEAGGYGKVKGSSIGGLALYEYFTVFFLLGYLFSNKSVIKKRILLACGFIYCLKALSLGGRVEIIQFFLLVFILFFEKTFSVKKILLVLVIGYFFNEIFGVIRANPALLFDGGYSFILKSFTFDYDNVDIIINNQGDIWYASARLLGFIKDGILDIGDRLYSFFNWVLSIFLPSKFVSAKANLASYLQSDYPSGGGSLISIYFYTWLSLPGVVFIAAYLSKLINNAYNSKNQYLVMYVILILSTFPRWFGYNPISMFKLSFYIIPLYFIYKTMSRYFLKSKI